VIAHTAASIGFRVLLFQPFDVVAAISFDLQSAGPFYFDDGLPSV
jgi:hypothetical protein